MIAALRDSGPVYVRFGSGADIIRHLASVRFTPKSGQRAKRLECPLSAKSGRTQRSKNGCELVCSKRNMSSKTGSNRAKANRVCLP